MIFLPPVRMPSVASRAKASKKLAADIQAFLASGGEIKQIPAGKSGRAQEWDAMGEAENREHIKHTNSLLFV